MAKETFVLAVKSTIDFVGKSIANAMTPMANFVDLDDITSVEVAMSSNIPCVVWNLNTYDESPSDPLYSVTFDIGARTSDDASNYDMMRMIGIVSGGFCAREIIDIKDYSDTVESASQGRLHVVSSTMNPQAYDRTSGVRLVTVIARAQRWL